VLSCFNPRARTGRDQSHLSTKLPMWRFNPRARTGRDILVTPTSSILALFQSTRPHGARPLTIALSSRPLVVSIHAPARGATSYPAYPSPSCKSFQSTRPHGARPNRVNHNTEFLVCFNPRARTGRDRRRLRTCARMPGFNPRARTGRDYLTGGIVCRSCCFNPRARTGRDFL